MNLSVRSYGTLVTDDPTPMPGSLVGENRVLISACGDDTAGLDVGQVHLYTLVSEPTTFAFLAVAGMVAALARARRTAFSMAAILALSMTYSFFNVTPAQAKKPDNPGGGGPGGSAYEIIPFAPFGLTSTKSFVGDLNGMGTMAVGGAELPSGQWRAAHLDIASGVYTTFGEGVDDLSGINNHNQMIGRAGGIAAFWDGLSATPVALPPLAGDAAARAIAINDAGIIIGESGTEEDIAQPDQGVGVVWRVTKDDQNLIIVDGPLALPTTVQSTLPHAINELSGGQAQIVGEQFGLSEGALWTVEVGPTGQLLPLSPPQEIGTLNLESPSWSIAYGINDDRDVVGASDGRPFQLTAGATMEELSMPRKALHGAAVDVNNADEIVGRINLLPKRATPNLGWGFDHAAIWQDGEPTLLETLIDPQSGWETLTIADDITDNGVITGYGQYEVQFRGFLLIPSALSSVSATSIPEPATAPLFVSGAVMLAIWRGRRAFLYQRRDLSNSYSSK